jgi:hypothetical protein
MGSFCRKSWQWAVGCWQREVGSFWRKSWQWAADSWQKEMGSFCSFSWRRAVGSWGEKKRGENTPETPLEPVRKAPVTALWHPHNTPCWLADRGGGWLESRTRVFCVVAHSRGGDHFAGSIIAGWPIKSSIKLVDLFGMGEGRRGGRAGRICVGRARVDQRARMDQ